MVARGEVDLYVNTYPNFSDWDICAGDMLVTEAGGTGDGDQRVAGPLWHAGKRPARRAAGDERPSTYRCGRATQALTRRL